MFPSPAPSDALPPLSPLPIESVLLVLDLITQTSPFSPFPPYLLSSALRQRHHFLGITADNPQEYLVWPDNSFSQQQIIDLVESLPKPIELLNCSVRYSADPESAFAHVSVPHGDPGLRLVFQWELDGWKYHNISLMPFPAHSFESIQIIGDAMSYKPHEFLIEPPAIVTDDESYWDAYGRDDELDRTQISSTETTEDAYWARYSSVHGSADSAIPTPVIPPKPLDHERVMLPLPGQQQNAVQNPLEPPSPGTLIRCLTDLPPRAESPPLEDSDSGTGPSFTPSIPSPSTISRNKSLSPSFGHDAPINRNGDHISGEQPDGLSDESTQALKGAIRSVYRLWRTGRDRRSPVFEEGEEFMEMVRQVVAEFAFQ